MNYEEQLQEMENHIKKTRSFITPSQKQLVLQIAKITLKYQEIGEKTGVYYDSKAVKEIFELRKNATKDRSVWKMMNLVYLHQVFFNAFRKVKCKKTLDWHDEPKSYITHKLIPKNAPIYKLRGYGSSPIWVEPEIYEAAAPFYILEKECLLIPEKVIAILV